ncbi:hypothetical protein AMQ83_29430, partial [Paenibacillus riograndensis]
GAQGKSVGPWAATEDATATKKRAQGPTGGHLQKRQTNQGKITAGSAGVKITGKLAARTSEPGLTCNDPAELPVGKVVAAGTGLIGG